MDYKGFKQFVQSYTEGFVFENEAFLSDLVNYFSDGDSTHDKNKGILLRGSVGVGKTSMLKLIQTWLPAERKFMYNPANELVSLFNSEGDAALNVYKNTKSRLFDDIGAEDLGRHYGNSVEVVQKVIYARYDLYRSQGIRTHFTTNLGNKELKNLYGDRAYDRIKEMVNVVNWVGSESKRGVHDFSIRQLGDLPKVVTKEEIEKLKLYEVKLICEIFYRIRGYFDTADYNMINIFYDTLKGLGYVLGESRELRMIYMEQRAIEIDKHGYWRTRNKRAFLDYKDKKFMSVNRDAMNRNTVHREVSKRCRKLVLIKFFDENKELGFDLAEDILERFNSVHK